MTTSYFPIHSSTHGNVYIAPKNSFKHVETHHVIPAFLNEFVAMSGNYPVVFVKDAHTGQFKAAAVMGLEEEKNLIFSEQYANANYIPLSIRCYPFQLLTGENEESFSIGLDAESDWINQKREGYPLFTEAGQPSEELQQIAEFIKTTSQQEALTEQFVSFLAENELLRQTELTVSLGATTKTQLNGIYQIDMDKLRDLNDDKIIDLHKRNYNPAIYAHLASMHQFQKLVNLSAKK